MFFNKKDCGDGTVTILLIKKESTLNKVFGLLCKRCVGRGICYTSKDIFAIDISNDEWVRNFTNGHNMYWFVAPYKCNTKDEMVSALQMRIDRLKLFL